MSYKIECYKGDTLVPINEFDAEIAKLFGEEVNDHYAKFYHKFDELNYFDMGPDWFNSIATQCTTTESKTLDNWDVLNEISKCMGVGMVSICKAAENLSDNYLNRLTCQIAEFYKNYAKFYTFCKENNVHFRAY